MESLKLVENVYWLGIQDHDLEVFDVVMETNMEHHIILIL